MNLLAKVSWLQKMYNYLYSRITGVVRTVNGTAPDANGNVVVSGGSSGTLQIVTTGTGNNLTSNAIQVTGIDNIDESTPSLLLGKTSTQGIIYSLSSTGLQGITFDSSDGSTSFLNGSGLQSVQLKDPNTGPAGVFQGRVSGIDAVNPTEFVTLQQIGNLIITPNVVTQSTSLSLLAGTYYTYNGTVDAVFTLPSTSGSTGTRIAVINQSSSNLTVDGTIFTNGSNVSSISLAPGETNILYDNSLSWVTVA